MAALASQVLASTPTASNRRERPGVRLQLIDAAGRHRAEFDASRLQSGVYFVRLQADGWTRTKRLMVVR